MSTRIAIAAENEQGLDATISQHFGRCPYFTVVDLEDGELSEVQSVANPYFANHAPGQVPAFINSLDAQVLITGGMGRRALTLFEDYGIGTATASTGTVRDAITAYLQGELPTAGPCPESAGHGCS